MTRDSRPSPEWAETGTGSGSEASRAAVPEGQSPNPSHRTTGTDTIPTPLNKELIERLRAQKIVSIDPRLHGLDPSAGKQARELINPDGPEAADEIERLHALSISPAIGENEDKLARELLAEEMAAVGSTEKRIRAVLNPDERRLSDLGEVMVSIALSAIVRALNINGKEER